MGMWATELGLEKHNYGYSTIEMGMWCEQQTSEYISGNPFFWSISSGKPLNFGTSTGYSKHFEKGNIPICFLRCFFSYWCLAGNEGMIHNHLITSDNHPSNPQQPIHSLLSTSKFCCTLFIQRISFLHEQDGLHFYVRYTSASQVISLWRYHPVYWRCATI